MLRIKRIIILAFVLSPVFLNAQANFNLDSITGADITSTQLIIDTIPTDNLNLPHIYVQNNTGSIQDWIITRKIVQQPNDWFNYLCWGDLCYGISTDETWSSVSTTIDNLESKELTLYVGAPSVGTAHYRYYVSTDEISFVDSFDVVINADVVSLSEELKTNQISIFPNPAKEQIQFEGTGHEQYDISIYKVNGQQVLRTKETLKNPIDINHLENGKYIVILHNLNKHISIKKQLIINQ